MTDAAADPAGDQQLALAFMRRQPLFADLENEDLERLHGMASTRRLAAGEVLLTQGEPGDEMFIVMEGELEVSRRHAGQEGYLATRGVGDVLGEMALLSDEQRSATVRALTDARLLVIDRAAFASLLACSGTAALTILGTVAGRLRRGESLLMQQEKLASLGTMAAGLAHELNNPAAAVGRSLAQLREAWTAWRQASLRLAALPWSAGGAEALTALADAPDPAEEGSPSDREEELSAWLEREGIEPAWQLAPALADVGYGTRFLAERLAGFERDRWLQLVRWLASAAEVEGALVTGETGTRAISAIVGAVRDYAYLDRAPLQTVDVRKGLEDTLLMLRSRLKEGIEVVRDFADDLPEIPAYGSELNQVWTNLIANAVDAMDGRGRLWLHARRRNDQLLVEICDDGPGIAPEALPRIFDPFFTTKGVGVGNGLGLHIVYDLVVRRHHGRLDVASRPGSTCFQVLLPIEPAPAEERPNARSGGP